MANSNYVRPFRAEEWSQKLKEILEDELKKTGYSNWIIEVPDVDTTED